jgi:hypothetical protein
MDTAGVITQDTVTWDFDLEPEKWARWTLFYEWSTPISGDGIWSDLGTYDDGGVWDSDLTVLEVADIRLVPTQWNAAHCDGKVFLLTDDHELWDYPTGTWGDAGDWEDYPPASLCLS